MKRLPTMINALFWGLMIVFIDINIMGFDILNDYLGMLIIIFALFKLKNYSAAFTRSLIFAMIAFAWQIFCPILNYSVYSKSSILGAELIIVGSILNMFMIWFLLNGLAELETAQQHEVLPSRLRRANIFNIAAVVSGTASVYYPKAAIALIVIAFILYIYILVQIRSAYKNIADMPDECRKPSRTASALFIAGLVLMILVPAALGIGVIAFSDNFDVLTAPFVKSDLPEDQTRMQAIRSKMVEEGFDIEVVDSMPDSEIAHYENVKSVQLNKSDEQTCDEGAIEVRQYISSFENKAIRLTVFYKWNRKPELAHAEALGLYLDREFIKYDLEAGFTSMNLYDKEDEAGKVLTYTSSDVKQSKLITNLVKRFSLPDLKKGSNYRGYMALDIKVVDPNLLSFNNVYYYVHQSTIFNNKGVDIIDYKKGQTGITFRKEDPYFNEFGGLGFIKISQ